MRTRGFVLKLGVSDPQVVRVDDLIAHAKEIIETLKLAAVEFEYDGIGYSVDNSGRVLQNCTSSIWTVLREGAEKALVAPDPRDEALRVAAEALRNCRAQFESHAGEHAWVEVCDFALAAIRAAGGAR